MCKYSVIIPHRNTPNLLRRQIESIPIRNDLEVLVIDDNSTTVTSGEWRQFQHDYPHVRLHLTTSGKGAGYARNVGLSHAVGQWVVFADADDFFYPHAFNYLDRFSDSKLDVVYFVCDNKNGTTMEPCADRLPNIRRFIKERNIDRLRYNSHVPWGKMIRRSMIEENHLRFDEVEVSNDVMFSMRVGFHVKNADVIEEPLYCCTDNPGSLYFYRTVNRAKIRLDVIKKANDFLCDNGLNDFRLTYTRAAHINIRLLLRNNPIECIRYLWKIRYRDDHGRYLKEVYSSMKGELYSYLDSHLDSKTKSVLRSIKHYSYRR